MIAVEEAQTRIIESLEKHRPSTELLSIRDALDRILAEPMVADLDSPPFDNSAMDGYAVQAESLAAATPDRPVRLEIVGTSAAGHPIVAIGIAPFQCYRIMTGAPVPEDANAVVQSEWTTLDAAVHNTVWVSRPVPKGLNIRRRGSDIRQGSTVLAPGTRITPAIIGILATLGKERVRVYQKPRVAIISTGDELVDPDQVPLAGQIRNSNTFALEAAVRQAGGDPTVIPHAPDNLRSIIEKLDQAAGADLILSSGGVSVGDFDFVKQALEAHGTQSFWRVNMKPGKPVTFGHYRNTAVFGLPGNPVSALVTFELFVRPFIRQWQGDPNWARVTISLPLLEDFNEVSDRRHYVRAQVRTEDGIVGITPNPDQGSSIQTSWLSATGLMIIPEHQGPLAKGTRVPVMLIG